MDLIQDLCTQVATNYDINFIAFEQIWGAEYTWVYIHGYWVYYICTLYNSKVLFLKSVCLRSTKSIAIAITHKYFVHVASLSDDG